MLRRAQSLLLRPDPPPASAGILVSVAAVAVSTAIVYPLDRIAPVLSLGVVYLVAVLLVSAVWGAWLGVLTSVLSAAAFNFFHIPPTGRFTIAESENWIGLLFFLIAALIASSIAQVARARAAEADRRRREADLAAEMARLLLRTDDIQPALAQVAQRLAQALSLPSAAIELRAVEGDGRRIAFPLRDGARQIGTVLVPADLPEETLRRLQERVMPSLEALLQAALEREDMSADVVEAAALRHSDVVKTAILRAVSHDLRSPLTAILASAEALRSPSLGAEEQAELADVVAGEASRLARVIDQLLDLSRLEAGAAEPRQDWCGLDEVLEATVSHLGTGPDAVAISVQGELPLLRADAAQLERAFANLLDNGLRHGGGQPVTVRARAQGGRVVVRVTDRGPGIPPAQQKRIFEPFFRVESSAGESGRGAGLGLAIAKGFLEANGASIAVESLPGQGTTFVVELPVPAGAADHAAAERGAAAP